MNPMILSHTEYSTFENQLNQLLETEHFEFGFTNGCKTYIDSLPIYCRHYLIIIYGNAFANKSPNLPKLLQILSWYVEEDEAIAAFFDLTLPNCLYYCGVEVVEGVIRIIEQSGDKKYLPYLKDLRLREWWLMDYVQQVINYLESM